MSMFYSPSVRYSIVANENQLNGFLLFLIGKGAIEDDLEVTALTIKYISPSMKDIKSII
jgi:hypothetical protein